MLNEQISFLNEHIRRLESSSILSQTPTSLTKSAVGDQVDSQQLLYQLKEKTQLVAELEQYLADQTSKANSEQNLSRSLEKQLRKLKHEHEIVRAQEAQLQYFIEEKDAVIMDME